MIHDDCTMNTLFPYGTFPVAPDVRAHYQEKAPSLAAAFPLPEYLPLHHPLLQRLAGVYPFSDGPAPWWTDFVTQLASPCLRDLLGQVSPQEYRAGCIEESRWRTYKAGHQVSGCTRDDCVPSSPKLMGLVKSAQHTLWEELFEARGPKETPGEMDLIISFAPEYFIMMSNGQDWTSCMHYARGEYKEQLPSNWYDTGVAIVAIVPRGQSIWEEKNLIARTTLRVVQPGESSEPWLVLGKIYTNNWTVDLRLIAYLARLIAQQGIALGCIDCINTCWHLHRGLCGPHLRFSESLLQTRGAPFWLPATWRYPYFEGTGEFWYSEDRQRLTFEDTYDLPAPTWYKHYLSCTIRAIHATTE